MSNGFSLTEDEIKNLINNTALSDEEMMKASGGHGDEEAPPKFKVGDRVRMPNAPGAGTATVIRIEKDAYFSFVGWKYVVSPDNEPGNEGWAYEKWLVLA